MFAQIKKIDAKASAVVLKAQEEADAINKETEINKARLIKSHAKKLEKQKEAMQERAQKETQEALAAVELKHKERLKKLKDGFKAGQEAWANEIFERIVKR